MAKRSPILGYNHNVRHRGLLFHVQTEDSGIDNPHIYTHLFHGGVIISSRKLEYDRGSAEDVVKVLMQAQHKASLRDLKSGTFDAKISSYLGDHPELKAAATAARSTAELRAAQVIASSVPPRPPPPPPLTPVRAREQMLAHADDDLGMPSEPSRTSRSGDVSAAFRAIKRESTAPGVDASAAAADIRAAGARRKPAGQTGYAHHHTGQLELMPDIPDLAPPAARGKGKSPAVVSPVAARPPAGAHGAAGKPHAPAVPPLRPAGKPRPPAAAGARPSVVVSRPAIIVGAPPRVVSPRQGSEPPIPRPAGGLHEDSRPSLFGKDLISERSLDEVILAYLSEDATEK